MRRRAYLGEAAGGTGWTNYSLRFRLRLHAGGIHAKYRLSDEGRYFVGFREDGVYLNKGTPWGEFHDVAGSGLTVEPGVWHRVEIVGQEAHLRVFLDGTLVIEVHDPEPLTRGTIAFETLDDSHAYVDDVQVTATPDAIVAAPPWWAEQMVMAHETFDQEDPAGWSLGDGTRLVPRDKGRMLVVEEDGRAVWHTHSLSDGRLDFRYRPGTGAGTVALRLSQDVEGERMYVLFLDTERIGLWRLEAHEEQELATGELRLDERQWYDVTAWLEGGRILILVDGRTIIEVEDLEPLPAGVFAFGGEQAHRKMYASIRLFSGPGWMMPIPVDAEFDETPAELLEQDIWKGAFAPQEKLSLPPVWEGPFYAQQEVRLTIQLYLGNQVLSPIDPGVVPPSYVHTWGIDITGFSTFRLDFGSSSDLELHWSSGDQLTVIDSWGQVVERFRSQQDVQQKTVTILPTAFDAGQPHLRFYLTLETSSLDRPRRFRLRGFLNSGLNTGAEEALLVGDDLNYDWTLGAFFETPSGHKVYQPWLKKGPNTNPFIDPPPPPKTADGWYLVGKNTTDEEQGFLSLAYYNERKSRLRTYLLNLDLFQGASGYAVSFRLRGRDTAQFRNLEGAFFALDPRPQKWHQATVLIPKWPAKTWAVVEVPFLYPMAKELPAKQSGPTSNVPAQWYHSIYEDTLRESLHNVLLQIVVTPFFKGSLQGDLVGQAIGEAIQKIDSGSGPSAKDIVTGAYEAFSQGKDWYGKGKEFHKKVQEFYDDAVKKGLMGTQGLGNLLKLGASAWGGALAAAGAGMAIYESFFSQSEPLQLSIELALRAQMSGSVFTEFQPAFHEFYLPARFSISDAFFSDQQSKDRSLLEAALARYDRTMGHLGFRYDPTTVEMRVLRRDCSQSQPDYEKGTFEEYPMQWDWFTSFYFPSVANPVTNYPVKQEPGQSPWMDLSVNAIPPRLDRLLPVIYNPYAEITPMTPTVVSQSKVAPPANFEADKPWFWWIHDISWNRHIQPEADDTSFPGQTTDHGPGPAIHVRVFNASVGHATARGVGFGKQGIVSAEGVGIWLDVEPLPRCVPSTYRTFQANEVKEIDAHMWRWGSFSKKDPLTGGRRYFDPQDPFPLRDVVFYWDVAYFYYGRTRKEQGVVPRSFEVVSLQAPVTIAVTRHVFGCETGQQAVTETHRHQKVKSRLLVE